MDSSVSLKDQIWFLRMCHHVPNVLYVWTCFSTCTVLFWVLPQSCLNCKLLTFFQIKWTGNIKFKCSPGGNFVKKNCCCNLQRSETKNPAKFFRIHKKVRDKNRFLPQNSLNCRLLTFFQIKWTGNIKFKCSPGGKFCLKKTVVVICKEVKQKILPNSSEYTKRWEIKIVVLANSAQ
jgi:hypothetical protein